MRTNLKQAEVTAINTQELKLIPVDSIVPNRHQPRRTFDQKALEELAESIDAEGLIQPITVREIDDGEEGIDYEIIAGERRWRAHQLLSKKYVSAVIQSEATEQKSQLAALIENIQREDLNPMEEAEALRQIMQDQKLTQQQLAQKLSKSRVYIAQSVRLCNLPPQIKELVSSQQLDKWHGLALLGIKDTAKQLDMANKAVKQQWSMDTLKKRVAALEEKDEEEEGTASAKKAPRYTPNVASLILIEAPSEKALQELKKALEEEGEFKVWAGREATKTMRALLKKPEEKEEKEETDEE